MLFCTELENISRCPLPVLHFIATCNTNNYSLYIKCWEIVCLTVIHEKHRPHINVIFSGQRRNFLTLKQDKNNDKTTVKRQHNQNQPRQTHDISRTWIQTSKSIAIGCRQTDEDQQWHYSTSIFAVSVTSARQSGQVRFVWKANQTNFIVMQRFNFV